MKRLIAVLLPLLMTGQAFALDCSSWPCTDTRPAADPYVCSDCVALPPDTGFYCNGTAFDVGGFCGCACGIMFIARWDCSACPAATTTTTTSAPTTTTTSVSPTTTTTLPSGCPPGLYLSWMGCSGTTCELQLGCGTDGCTDDCSCGGFCLGPTTTTTTTLPTTTTITGLGTTTTTASATTTTTAATTTTIAPTTTTLIAPPPGRIQLQIRPVR